MDPRKQVTIDYTNYRNQRSQRIIEPVEGQIVFNYNQWHSVPQWLLTAVDVSGDGTLKTFAIKDIHSWVPLPIDSKKP